MFKDNLIVSNLSQTYVIFLRSKDSKSMLIISVALVVAELLEVLWFLFK